MIRLPPEFYQELGLDMIANHARAVALHFMHYKFCRIHQTLQSTPAIKAGVSDHVWTIEELVGLLDSEE